MAGDGHHIDYVKVYWVLLALLVVSILGPELEIRPITLFTAFGVAVIKAYLVVKNFMHINLSPRYVTYLSATCLVFMLLFFAGTAPDVMNENGDNWRKPRWEADSAAWAAGDHSDPYAPEGAEAPAHH